MSAFLLAEEALQLLFTSGLATLSVYIIGTVPFLLGLLAYVGTMAHSGYAHAYLGTGALGMALLFIWMKAFHARFAQHLRARLHDEALPPWSAGQFSATLCRQGLIHATAVIVYPVAFVTVLPMGFAVALYQNASVLDDGGPMTARGLAARALSHAGRWPLQNHILLWLCSPFMVLLGAALVVGTYPILNSLEETFLVSLGTAYATILLLAALPLAPFAVFALANVFTGLYFALEMFHVFTAADTLFARSPGALLNNDLAVACACATTYLLLDPILKAAYTIRCHEGESLSTGADLRVALRRIRALAGCVIVLAMAAMSLAALARPAAAGTPSAEIEAAPLNQAIESELAERRYAWRMPREARPDVELPWLLQIASDFGESVRDWIKKVYFRVMDFYEKVRDFLFGGGSGEGGEAARNFDRSIRILTGVLAVLLFGATLYFLWSMYRGRKRGAPSPVAVALAAAPDLRDESTTAADLPEEEWTLLARELASQGEFRLAARALFFAMLATLAQREIIMIARFKSNMDYGNELMRRAAAIGNIPQVFSRGAFLYEAVWYGEHEATPQTLEALYACREELRHGLN